MNLIIQALNDPIVQASGVFMAVMIAGAVWKDRKERRRVREQLRKELDNMPKPIGGAKFEQAVSQAYAEFWGIETNIPMDSQVSPSVNRVGWTGNPDVYLDVAMGPDWAIKIDREIEEK